MANSNNKDDRGNYPLFLMAFEKAFVAFQRGHAHARAPSKEEARFALNMSTPAEQVEQQFDRLRMADPPLTDSQNVRQQPHTPPSSEPSEQPLDHSITAEQANDLKQQGNASYKNGDYTTALEYYTKAATSAHASAEDRAIYLANRGAVNLKLQRFADVVKDTTLALSLKPSYVKALARRKDARERLGEWRGALEDAQALGEPDSEIQRLKTRAEDKESHGRQQAMDSLKGLGNSILSNFGMSIDDFAVEKDENTGSYSVKMK